MGQVRRHDFEIRGAEAGRSRSAGRVMFVVTEDWYFWSHRLDLARAVRDEGYHVAVATPPGPLEERIRAEGFEFFPLRLRRTGRNPMQELAATAQLWSLFRRWRPDVAHLVAMKPILYGGLAARLARVDGVVCAVAGLGYVFLPGSWTRRLGRIAVERVYRHLLAGRRFRFILQNPDDVALFRERALAPPQRLALIRGAGVDTRRFSPCPEPGGVPIVLMHSRMLRDKGIVELVEATRILRQREVDCRVRLVGDPDPANPSSIPEATLRDWHSEGVIEWLGKRDDVPSLLADSHVACLPSYREGTPLSLVEAAAAGRPIVATDVPGCRGVVVDGDNGFLVPPRDPVSLATALARLVTNPGLRRAMGRRSREIAEATFAREVVARQTLELYRELEAAS